MAQHIRYFTAGPHEKHCSIEAFSLGKASRVRDFHRSFSSYQPTPFVSLSGLAETLGVSALFVKDESPRFGLNSFKSLGGSFAVGSLLAEKAGKAGKAFTYGELLSYCQKNLEKKPYTFITATDGNHGRGLAWTARQFRQHAVVYLPAGSSQERLRNIQAEGAEAYITRFNYDDTVAYAGETAEKNGWILMQDTAFGLYEKIPRFIMQGYLTMALEACEQMTQKNERPTHVFLQAGVGSMAAAVTAFLQHYYAPDPPMIVTAEPEKADCIFRTAQAEDGKLCTVRGPMDTIMAGLACGRPSKIGWPILRDYASGYLSFSDPVAAKGMRILSAPVGGDERVISGESGAAAFGAVCSILGDPDHADLKSQLHLDEHSKILCFSTEGDTDKQSFRRIVWDGAYAVDGPEAI